MGPYHQNHWDQPRPQKTSGLFTTIQGHDRDKFRKFPDMQNRVKRNTPKMNDHHPQMGRVK